MIKINFTKHATDMLIERRFQRELIEDIVAHPEWVEKDDEDIWFAFKRIDRKVLRVVIRGSDPALVVTMYFDRRLR